MQKASGIEAGAVRELIGRVVPDVDTVTVCRFGADDATGRGQTTEKGFGYGEPLLIRVRTAAGEEKRYVFHTAGADIFGHDRRSDRAQSMLLAAETFSAVPRHVRVLDVGAINADGSLQSLDSSEEFYLLTEYAPGAIYADDLRQVARRGAVAERDRRRCALLADYLAALHREQVDGRPAMYRRAIRDLVGHGEGIFGIIDGYPAVMEGVTWERLRAIEEMCWEWRWKLRGCEYRLARTHGDFHPFNIVFDDDEIALLDASRGSHGDPADDVSCLAINYVFFALGHRDAWHGGLGELWHGFWQRYLDRSGDREVLEVAPPFFAWRGLVLANPTWYPAMSADHRDALLGLVEEVLAADRLDPACVERLFA